MRRSPWVPTLALLALCGVSVACGAEPSGTGDEAGGAIASGGQPVTGGAGSGGALSGWGGSGGAPAGGTGGRLPVGGSPPNPTATGGTIATGGGPGIGGIPLTGGGGAGGGSGGSSPAAGGSGTDESGGSAGSPDALTGGQGSGTGGAQSTGGIGTGGIGTGGSASGGIATGGEGGAGASGGEGEAAGRPTVEPTPGSTLVKIDVDTRYQTFEGWGTSLAWWAYQIGGWSSAKRDEFLELIVDPTSGLGYNVFRYNIGGGDDPSHEHMGENREMPGFQSSAGAWDWNADARQTSVLRRLVERGEAVIVEAFSNSPPYWMTRSGCASGSADGSDNLQEGSYGAFATYLVTVTRHYRDELGIPFRTLEPMNEPNAGWWKADGGQEGCHFGASSQERIIQAVADELGAQGVTETGISASDENSMDDAHRILGGYGADTLAALVQMNVHSYAGSRRRELRELASAHGKRLWQSESGPLSVDLASNTDAAMFMAGRIIQDLRELQPEAWIEWQVVDPAVNWTSFSVNDARETWQPLKRFFAQAGFSRYIRPGATFVDIDDANMVAASSRDGTRLTVVVRNGDAAGSRSYTFDLTSLPSVGAAAEVHRTSTTEDLVELAPVPITGYRFDATVPAQSITTFVIPVTG